MTKARLIEVTIGTGTTFRVEAEIVGAGERYEAAIGPLSDGFAIYSRDRQAAGASFRVEDVALYEGVARRKAGEILRA